ncbi:hypothetical protein [Mesorhizobium escarrei]|uniref:Transcriptional regulator n=1 Tax=Mesorhizobium escarrei TaxID=666018 RepID=A0ABM9E929_9HYPH|nr:hypothetical protein [Mesorhizobium escarrei]CAH2405674.1 hypothetical protein MES5069_480050 [Mesorhizobium escarrei]
MPSSRIVAGRNLTVLEVIADVLAAAGTVFRVSLFYAGNELQPSNHFDRLG